MNGKPLKEFKEVTFPRFAVTKTELAEIIIKAVEAGFNVNVKLEGEIIKIHLSLPKKVRTHGEKT